MSQIRELLPLPARDPTLRAERARLGMPRPELAPQLSLHWTRVWSWASLDLPRFPRELTEDSRPAMPYGQMNEYGQRALQRDSFLF